MTRTTVTAAVAGVGLTILGFWLDRTGSAGMWLLIATIILIVAFYYRDRVAEGKQFFLGALGVIPLVLVVAFSWPELYQGAQRVLAQDDVVDIASPAPPAAAASADVSHRQAAQSEFEVTIESPAERASVPLNGVTVDGRLSGVQDQRTLWLFVKSLDDGGRHYLTDMISVVGQYWSLSTGRLGSDERSEIGKLFIIEVVATKGSVTRSLEAHLKKVNGGDFFFAELPDGAEVVAERVIKRV